MNASATSVIADETESILTAVDTESRALAEAVVRWHQWQRRQLQTEGTAEVRAAHKTEKHGSKPADYAIEDFHQFALAEFGGSGEAERELDKE